MGEGKVVLPARLTRQQPGAAQALVEAVAQPALLVVAYLDARQGGVDPDANHAQAGPKQVFKRLYLRPIQSSTTLWFIGCTKPFDR